MVFTANIHPDFLNRAKTKFWRGSFFLLVIGLNAIAPAKLLAQSAPNDANLDSLFYSDLGLTIDSVLLARGVPRTSVKIVMTDSLGARLRNWSHNAVGDNLLELTQVEGLVLGESPAVLETRFSGLLLKTGTSSAAEISGLHRRTLSAPAVSEGTKNVRVLGTNMPRPASNLWNDTLVPILVTAGAVLLIALFFVIRS